MNTSFDISLIIPTCPHRREKLRALLAGIASSDATRDRFEVVIVVDDMDDGPLETARSMLDGINSRGFTQQQQGPARARNHAIREARGRWLLFFDDDALVDQRTISGHLDCIEHSDERPLAYLGRVDWPENRLTSPWSVLLARSSMLFFWDQMGAEQTYGFRHFWTSNLCVRRDWVLEVGGFNESFPSALHEDIELGYRLAQKFGLEVKPMLNIQSWHDHPISPREYFQREHLCGSTAAASRSINQAFHDAIWSWVEDPAGLANMLEQVLAKQAREVLELFERWAEPSSYEPSADEMQAAYLAHVPLKRLCFCRGYAGLPFDDWWDELSATTATTLNACPVAPASFR